MTSGSDKKDIRLAGAAKGVPWLSVKILYSQILAFAFLALMARTKEFSIELGQISAVMMLVTVLSGLGAFSSREAISKLISTALGSGKNQLAYEIQRSSIEIGIFTCSLSGLGAAAIFFLISQSLGISNSVLIIAAIGIDTTMLAFLGYVEGIFQGKANYSKVSVISMLFATLRQSTAIVSLLVYGSVESIILGWGIGGIIGGLVAIGALLANLNSVEDTRHSRIALIVKSTIPIYTKRAADLIIMNFESFIALILLGIVNFGTYRLLFSLTVVSSAIWTAFSMVCISEVSYAYGKGEMNQVASVTPQISRYIFISFIPIAATLAAFSPLIAWLAYGGAYVQYSWIVFAVHMAQLLLCQGILASSAIIAIGRAHILLMVNLVTVPAMFIVGYLTIPLLGIFGVLICRLGIRMFLTLIPLSYLYVKEEIAIDFVAYGKVAASSLWLIIPTLFFYVFNLRLDFAQLMSLVAFIPFILSLRFFKAIDAKDIEGVICLLPSFLRSAVRRVLRKVFL